MKRIMQVIVIFLCCSVGKVYGTTACEPSNDIPSFISASHIYNDEVRDTTWAMERGTSLSLPDVFRYILPIQTIGRAGLEYDPYLLKCQEFLDTLRILRDYIGDVKRDTVFIVEKISKAQDYYIEVLREPDSILRLTDTGLWSLTKKQKLLRQRENSYIINWNKNLLQE